MKKLLFICTLVFAGFHLSAQTPPPKEITPINWDEIIVKDSAGLEYPTAVWRGLLTGGKYGIRLSADKKQAVLYRISEQEMMMRHNASPKPAESEFFTTGSKMRSFNVKDMNGNRLNMKQLLGKVVVLNFWFINCPPCRAEIPELNNLVKTYALNQDVVFIAVALDQRWELSEFLKKTPYNYQIVDDGRYIADQNGIRSYPTHVVVNKEGNVIFHTSGLGMGTVNWVKKSIDAALNGQTLAATK